MPYIGNPAVDRFVVPRAASVYSGDGSTVAFTLEHSVGSDEDILVSVDGVIQEPSVAYAVSSGTTLTFTAAPSSNSGNNIFVYYLFRTIGTVTHPPTSALSATSLNTSGNVVHNEAGADVDFRVESDGNANMLFVDGGTNKVGIGTASPNTIFTTSSASEAVGVSAQTATTGSFIGFKDATSTNWYYNHVGAVGDNLKFTTGGSEKMRIDATGAVTMPLQPAFLAQPASGQNNIAVGSHVPIVFGTERFDQNADFASNTFTAPVTGKYQLNFSIYLVNVDSAASFYQMRLVTSNRIFSTVFDPDFGQDAVYQNSTLALLVDMDAADTAYVDIRQGSGTSQTDIDTDTTFSGYLVA